MKTFLKVGLIAVIVATVTGAVFGVLANVEDTWLTEDDIESAETLDFGDDTESELESEVETEWTGTPNGEAIYYAPGFVQENTTDGFFVANTTCVR